MSLTSKLTSLINAANSVTSGSATTMTQAVQDLVDGYGADNGEFYNPYALRSSLDTDEEFEIGFRLTYSQKDVDGLFCDSIQYQGAPLIQTANDSGRLATALSSNGTSWNIGNLNVYFPSKSDITTVYRAKFSYDGTATYTLSLYYDNGTLIDTQSTTTSLKLYKGVGNFMISRDLQKYYGGKLFVSGTYIKQNGVVIYGSE